MKQRVVFYLPKGAVFEATAYYCNLIKQAFSELGCFDLIETDNPELINSDDYLVTIRLYDASHAKVRPKRIFHWFQGIAPEERLMESKSIKSFIGWFLCKKWERFATRDADVCFFVSDKMRAHFSNKYSVDLDTKSIVIPCYNIDLDNSVFVKTPDRYKELNFVYAGGMHQWQCIKETLLIFKAIHAKNSSAKLTLLTKDNERAHEMIEKFQVPNVTLKFVPIDKLQEELANFKYGFLLRKDHIVNNVATPTKMNSYLASGLIPIYTPVVDAFERNIDLGHFGVKIEDLNDIAEAVKMVLKNHEEEVDLTELENIYTKTFKDFYNDKIYISRIKDHIKLYNS